MIVSLLANYKWEASSFNAANHERLVRRKINASVVRPVEGSLPSTMVPVVTSVMPSVMSAMMTSVVSSMVPVVTAVM